MPDVQFNEQRPDLYSFKSRQILGQAETPAIARWFIKIGVAKTERAAGRLMVTLTLLFFAVSIYFFFF